MSRNLAIVLGVLVAATAIVAGVLLLRNGDETDVAAPTTTVVVAPPTTSESGSTTTADVSATTTTPPPAVGDYTPVFEAAGCEFDVVTDLDFRCGFLVVPENRSAPDNGREVRLHVAIFESPNPDAPDDPIVYLDGGPGGESLEPLQFTLGTVWDGFLENRDMIFFDQRGVGLSTPSLECTETRQLTFDLLDDDLPAEEYVARELQALTECRERLDGDGIDVTQYNSASNAADVADLRIALELDEWNVLGISYGTRLAETVMRDHPAGIRSVVLDSTYTPDVDLIASAPANFSRALDVFFAGCETDTACSEAYPDLEQRLFDLVARLDADPITAPVRDVFTNERYDAVFDGQTLLGVVFQGLYSEQVIPVLPQLVDELERGETTTLVLLATNNLANGAFFSYGMNLSVQCNEEVPFTDESEVAAAATAEPRLEEFFATASNIGVPVYDMCDLWQAGTGAPVENEPVTSDLPTLVMSGEYDPITPPAWGERASATLSNATYVEFPGVGHGASLSGDCPLSVATAFFDDPAAPVDTSCIAEMGGPSFVVPGGEVPSVVLVPFEDSIFGTTVTGVVPEGWEKVGPGAWTRGATGLDQTAVVQQVAPGTADPEVLIGLFSTQLGFEDPPESGGTIETGGRVWTLYRGVIDGFAADVALGTGTSDTGIVVLVSSAAERDELYETVMLPALDAFATG